MERLSDNGISIKLTDLKQNKVDHPSGNVGATQVIVNHLSRTKQMTEEKDTDVECGLVEAAEQTVEDKKVTESVEEDVNEEEVSLLEEERSPRSHPHPAIIISPKDSPRGSIQLTTVPPSKLTTVRLATPDPDIQLAEVETVGVHGSRHKRRPTCPSSSWSDNYQISSLQTVCGPNPKMVTSLCVIVLSIWASWMLLIHMNKKIDILTTVLTETQDKINTMEDSSMVFRQQSNQRFRKMHNQLNRILSSIKTDSSLPSSDIENVPYSSNDELTASKAPTTVKPPTPTKGIEDDDGKATTKNWWELWQ